MSNRLAHRTGRLDLHLPPSVVPPEPPEPPERGGREPRPGWLIHRLIWGLILGLTLGMIAWSVLAPTIVIRLKLLL
jgi:hypothetical protein